jgi:site-specific DNA-adenine methylase
MAETPTLTAPFPYFGGKSRIANIVWSAFGVPKNYVEPFCGSAAVLLARPKESFPSGCYAETINDVDGHLVNLWRSIQLHPEVVVKAADMPVSELDLKAAAKHCRNHLPDKERLSEELSYCDPETAGLWLYGACGSLGNCWSRLYSSLPHLGNWGQGYQRQNVDASAWLRALSDRLRRVRIICGDWKRAVSNVVLFPSRQDSWSVKMYVGVFLDPPYGATRDSRLYKHDSASVHQEVGDWCREHERDPGLRIALCGYEGEHNLPGWTEVPWKANGAFGKPGNGRSRINANRERLWLSPNCLSPDRAVSKAARAKLAKLARGAR